MHAGGLYKNDRLLEGERAQIDTVLWGGDEIDQLAHLCLKRRLECPSLIRITERREQKKWKRTHVVKELQEMDIVWLVSEMSLEEVIDGAFEHERVVDRDDANAFDAVPTGLSATSDRFVHDVVRDEQGGLQLSTRLVSRGEEHVMSAGQSMHLAEEQTKTGTHQLDTPSQRSRLEVLVVRQRPPFQDLR